MRSIWFLILLGSLITYHCLTTVAGEEAGPSTAASKAKPTLEQCKGYVDAALKTNSPAGDGEDSGEPPDDAASEEGDGDDSTEQDEDSKAEADDDEAASQEDDDSAEDGVTAEDDGSQEDTAEEDQSTEDDESAAQDDDATNEDSEEGTAEDEATAEDKDSTEADDASTENTDDNTKEDDQEDSTEDESQEQTEETQDQDSTENAGDDTNEDQTASTEGDTTESAEAESNEENDKDNESPEEGDSLENTAEDATAEEDKDATEEDATGEEDKDATEEEPSAEEDNATAEDSNEDGQSAEQDGVEEASDEATDDTATAEESEEGADVGTKSDEDDQSTDGDTQEDTGEEAQSDDTISGDVAEQADQSDESSESQEQGEETQEDQASTEDTGSPEAEDGVTSQGDAAASDEGNSGEQDASEEETGASEEDSEEEEEQEEVAPYDPRSRDHLTQILGLDDSEETKTTFNLLDKVTTTTLKELKSTYENAIKPLEQLYKYRDLSNRHFGDPEIFSKPLIVFMGPWSGGKSTIINWLLGIQHEDYALRTGADPSPAQFNIMMYGKEPEKLDGTQLAADWTFSGLQKFGQSFLDRLRGQKLPNRLLEKVNIVEIPGILEVRKQVERSFPFNDACQWFIDRADTLFLIYDPAKLDIGPETEAILDQLKGRENQVRIVLNKADTVKPDELLRVQAMLVWNISPLMSSAEPPVLYAASLWDRPLQKESPKSLLVAHENNFLKDIRDGIERRVETRIAAARRFAVRVRNHAKMVDCYLNTYNNHRSFFGDRKKISTDIIDHPQNYHIYEGLSTLTNISRYDLPDPDTYRDFFRINPIWDFPTLQSTCSFWRGCPLHKLDIAIAYDLPEILGKFRRQREAILSATQQGSSKN